MIKTTKIKVKYSFQVATSICTRNFRRNDRVTITILMNYLKYADIIIQC